MGISVRSALTARAVTTSTDASGAHSSARARTTVTLPRPKASACSVNQATRRSVGSGDSQDDSREARPRADVSSTPIEEGGSDRTIQNVPRPQSRKLQGTDESSGLALLGQSRRELTGKVDPLTEQGSRCGGFGLKSGHRCFT